MDVTLIWADEHEGMVPRVFYGRAHGPLSDHAVRRALLDEAMAAEMDGLSFGMAAAQMTTHILAIFEGHLTPRYLWDGDMIPGRAAN